MAEAVSPAAKRLEESDSGGRLGASQLDRAEPVGQELEPPKLIVVVPAARVAQLASARPLTVRLSAELLAAECLALVPFETRRP